MHPQDILNFFNVNKEHFIAIAGSLVAIASIVLQMLPVPDNDSNMFYKIVYEIIHKIALNKKVS